MLELKRPDETIEAAFWSFVKEQEESAEFVPYSARPQGRSFVRWLEDIARYEHAETCPPGFVPGTFLFLWEGDEIVGGIDIRHTLNDALRIKGGHIGYGIRPSRRRKGYATRMLAMALPVAREPGHPAGADHLRHGQHGLRPGDSVERRRAGK